MSLEMLLPPKAQRRRTSQPPARSQSQPARRPSSLVSSASGTAAYLESISSTFLSAINSRDFALVESMGSLYFDADMTSHIDDLCFAANHAEYLQKTLYLMRAAPQISALAKSVRAHVDEAVSLATVFISYEITGWAAEMAELKRSSVGMMRWRKRDGQWRCFQSVTLRGMGMFEGEIS